MKQYRYILSVLLAFCLLMPVMSQQTTTISGIVLDEKSEPVIGASVNVPGTKLATVTNLYGKFILKDFPATQKTIQVSYIGYQSQKVAINGVKDITVKLEPSNSELNEVVVVGYGSQKKASLTGSITQVSAKDVADLSTTNLATALKGQINGISISGGEGRPGSSATIGVRDAASTTAFSSVSGYVAPTVPLYVIDDYISSEAAFNNLDATMVESVSVLKNASAAVYGAKSAQGVILVKTKRGKEGSPKISYSGQFGVADEITRAKMLDAYSYGKIWNAVKAADKSTTWDPKTDLFQADELNAMRNLNYDLLEREWRAASTQKHSINVSGGSDKANYFAGVSYNTQDGNIGKLDYNRWNYRAGIDAKISNALKASLQVSGDYGGQTNAYSNVGSSTGDNDYDYLLTHPRYMPDYVNGLALASYGVSNSQYEVAQLYNYSTIQNLGNFSKNVSQNMTLNSSVEYDFGGIRFLKGLKAKLTYSKSISTNKNNTYGTNYNLYKVNLRAGSGNHLYSGADLDLSNANLTSITVSNGNILSRSMDRADNYQANFILSYARTFGKHDVSGLFTIERAELEGETLQGAVTNPYSFTNYQSNGTDNGTQTTVFTRSESGSLSYVGRLNYAYNNKYLLEFLVRSDASTSFAPENYWGTFPSLSAGWVLSEEPWFRESMYGIDFLKLRGSYGLLGQATGLRPWQWIMTYSVNQDKGAILGTSGATTSSGSHIGIPDAGINRLAKWDKSYQSNLGIDLTTLKNRLTVNVDGYYYMNRDVFMNRQGAADYPSTVGVQAAAENYGSMDRYGVELSVSWKDNITKNFKYWVKVNTGYSDNIVLLAPWPALIPIDQKHPNARVDVGSWGYESIGMFHNYQEIEEYFAKYDIKSYMGKTKDNVYPGMLIYNNIRGSQKADGSYYGPNDPADPNAGYVDENDVVQISNRSNPWGFTVNLGGEWKGLSFSTQIGANWGGYSYLPGDARGISSLVSTASGYNVMEYTNLPSFWANNMFVYEDVLDNQGNVVAEQNRTAKYPNLRYDINSLQSTFWRVSGTSASIKTLTVAYSLPKNWMKTISVESCRVNATVQNVLSLYNPYPDNFIDPMSGTYGRYPNLRRISIGVNVSF
ncbi:MAG: SusC/RagA family TonB-linked outer membrane protein [Paludibacter sp.]